MHCSHAFWLQMWALVHGKLQEWPVDIVYNIFSLFYWTSGSATLRRQNFGLC